VAATTHIASPARPHTPLAQWHLLSLDAPTVAAVWTWFIARSSGLRLPAASPIAMALAVWIVYAADRLLDANRADHTGDRSELEARHRFHHSHRSAFAACIAIAAIALGTLLPLLDTAAVRLYLIEGALLAVWLLLLHATRSANRLPKEIAVGIFFSAAVFIPTVARNPALRIELAPAAVLLSALCALNCLYIYTWEHHALPDNRAPDGRLPHATTRFALENLAAFAITMVLSAIALAALGRGAVRLIATACAISTALLHALHRSQSHLSRIHLRAAADLALLTPLLLLPILLHLPQ
jgi:hypothetical protein